MFIKKLNKIKPSKAFQKKLWVKLELDYAEMYPGLAVWYQTRAFRYASVVVMIVLVLGSGGAGAYAYSSHSVTEGSILYPVKQKIEKVEGRLQKTPEEKARYYIKIINRREAELRILDKYKKNVINTQKQLQQMESNLTKVQEWVEKKQIENPELKKQIQHRLLMKKTQLRMQQFKEAQKLKYIEGKQEFIKNTSTPQKLIQVNSSTARRLNVLRNNEIEKIYLNKNGRVLLPQKGPVAIVPNSSSSVLKIEIRPQVAIGSTSITNK